ncbi:MAG: UDP-N-acetylglucosamine 2-epimerase [Butyrivibrio sp.]|nr:UDP-N-acetylglucosamine 2-epimerase [Butyrivibrio sp.]
MLKKVAVVTATRAEYGILKNVIEKIDKSEQLELCLIVTGMHLVPEYGMTVEEIEQDGYRISEKVDILLTSNTPASVSKTMGLAMILFSEVFERQNPDMLIVLGDRYELLSVCSAAMNAGIPITHISGGETTQGAIDESIRHCITKMSYLHFPACEAYRKRIIQLGEEPERVYNFGDVGVETLRTIPLMSKEELEKSIDFSLDKPYLSVTFHPTTLESEEAEKQMKEVLAALEVFPDMKFVFTKANADAGGKKMNDLIDRYSNSHDNCIAFASLGIRRYLSLLRYSSGILGNSSSGIVEAPSFGIPTINIGSRQKGRLQADSILNCEPEREQIIRAVIQSQSKEFLERARNTKNPYGDGDVSTQIVKVITEYLYQNKIYLEKKFYDVI